MNKEEKTTWLHNGCIPPLDTTDIEEEIRIAISLRLSKLYRTKKLSNIAKMLGAYIAVNTYGVANKTASMELDILKIAKTLGLSKSKLLSGLNELAECGVFETHQWNNSCTCFIIEWAYDNE